MFKNLALLALVASVSAVQIQEQYPMRETVQQPNTCCRCPSSYTNDGQVIVARPETYKVLSQTTVLWRQNHLGECCACDPTNGYHHEAFNTIVPYDARGEGHTAEELNNHIKSIGAPDVPFPPGGPAKK